MGILDDIDDDLEFRPPVAATPELGLYIRWTEGSAPKILNCVYWLKHELFVYKSLQEKNWFVSRPSGQSRAQVNYKELSKALLEYYFLMVTFTSFNGERGREMSKLVDIHKFVDMILEHPVIKKLVDNPTLLV